MGKDGPPDLAAELAGRTPQGSWQWLPGKGWVWIPGQDAAPGGGGDGLLPIAPEDGPGGGGDGVQLMDSSGGGSGGGGGSAGSGGSGASGGDGTAAGAKSAGMGKPKGESAKGGDAEAGDGDPEGGDGNDDANDAEDGLADGDPFNDALGPEAPGAGDPFGALDDETAPDDSGIDESNPFADPMKRFDPPDAVYTPEFRDALHKRESQEKGYDDVSKDGGALGRYQMTKRALQDAGLMDKKGNWTGKHGVRGKEDFLKNHPAQEKALQDYLQRTEKNLVNKGVTRNLGKKIQGIKAEVTITKAGLAAAAHRQGAAKVKQYLDHVKKNGWKSTKELLPADEKLRNEFLSVETRLREFQGFQHRMPRTP